MAASSSLDNRYDFQPINEDWSTFEAEDGTLVRVRPVLVFIEHIHPSKGQSPPINFVVNVQITRMMAPGMRAKAEGKVARENLMFKKVSPSGSQSRYRIPEGEVILTAEVSRISRSHEADESGDPIYLVSHRVEVDFTPAAGSSRERKARRP